MTMTLMSNPLAAYWPLFVPSANVVLGLIIIIIIIINNNNICLYCCCTTPPPPPPPPPSLTEQPANQPKAQLPFCPLPSPHLHIVLRPIPDVGGLHHHATSKAGILMSQTMQSSSCHEQGMQEPGVRSESQVRGVRARCEE